MKMSITKPLPPPRPRLPLRPGGPPFTAASRDGMKQKKGDDPKGPSPLFLKNSGAVRPGVFSAPTARVFRRSLFRMIRTRRFLSRKAFHRESFLPVKYSDRSSLKEATPLLTFALRDGPTMPDRGRRGDLSGHPNVQSGALPQVQVAQARRVVGASHERSRGHGGEAHPEGPVFPPVEFFRRDIA